MLGHLQRDHQQEFQALKEEEKCHMNMKISHLSLLFEHLSPLLLLTHRAFYHCFVLASCHKSSMAEVAQVLAQS